MSHAATLERAAFAPPPTPGLIRAVLLALVAHGLLLLLLTAGVQWNRDVSVVAEAELWSAVPQEAAPPPPPPPELAPEPEVAPPPPQKVVEPPPQPAPDIALEREKKRKEQLAQQKAEQEKQEKLDRIKRQKLEQEKLEKDKAAKAKAEKERLEKERQDKEKAAKAKAKPPQADPKQAAAEARKLEELRQQNLKRMAGLAGGTDPNASGSAAQASGPSAGYAGRIRARIRPNIVFTDATSSNPVAEVEVRTSPDGTILSRRLTKPSGLKSWDDAVLNAIDKTEVLPRDVDGRVPTSLVISFRPRD